MPYVVSDEEVARVTGEIRTLNDFTHDLNYIFSMNFIVVTLALVANVILIAIEAYKLGKKHKKETRKQNEGYEKNAI